jgi:NAD(P)H-nitrite reductase large subunit
MQTHVIIGTSAAGLGVLNKLRSLDRTSKIICISDEKDFPYNKCFLADYVSGIKDLDSVYTKPESFFLKNDISLMLGKRVEALNTQEKKIRLDDGQYIFYDSLFLGTGSSPYLPSFIQEHNQVGGIYPFHTLSDSLAILGYVKENNVKKVFIVGAGLSGLEAADSLLAHGLEISVLSRHGRLIRRHIDENASLFIEEKMKAGGVHLIKGKEPQGIVISENRVSGIRLSDGTQEQADLIVIATGLQPNTALAKEAGLDLHNGYLIVDDCMQTSDSSIWAGGDCCAVKDQLTGKRVPSTLWSDAMLQGVIAAQSMAGGARKYPGVVPMINSAFFGTQLVTAGAVQDSNPAWDKEVRQGEHFYHVFVREGQRLRGFLLLGETGRAPELKRALLTGQ